MNKLKTFALATGAVLASGAGAFATDPDVAGIVTASSGLLSSIYPIVIGAVSFGILISLVKMVRRH